MMENTITSSAGYRYIYSSALNSFLLLSEERVNKEISQNNKGVCDNKRMDFLTEYGITGQTRLPEMCTEYTLSSIESNLANLNQLLIEVTDECNLACKYCSYGELYGNYDRRNGEKQRFDQVKILIDYLCDLWKSSKNISFDNVINIGFYGGEPLMNFHLIEQVVAYLETVQISEVTFVYNLTTNAVLLSKYMDYLVEKKFHLLISLDGSKKNNVHRIGRNGKETFEDIFSSIKKLQEKYPDYFDSSVNFNSVLHNQNSVMDIYEYIKGTFGKVPHISELNANGVSDEKRDEFNTLYSKKADSIRQAVNCGYVSIREVIEDTQLIQLNRFMMAYSGNVYKTMPDLFFSQEALRYYPTSTCPPFFKKIFLTVNGKLLPCERIGQKYPLGYIENGEVSIDMEEIQNFYAALYTPIVDKCRECLLLENCEVCVYYLPRDKEGKVTCPYFYGEKEARSYFETYLSTLENHPNLHHKMLKDILID